MIPSVKGLPDNLEFTASSAANPSVISHHDHETSKIDSSFRCEILMPEDVFWLDTSEYGIRASMYRQSATRANLLQ